MEKSEYLNNMVTTIIEASGVPTCFICSKRIVGAHIDYIDIDRVPRKVCAGCILLAIDFFIAERKKRMGSQ